MNKSDYKSTVFLPANVLNIRANLPTTEPDILARWEREDIYGQLIESRCGAPEFLLHDGPPYANGNLHMGHALNKILKDFVVRSRFMLGYKAAFTPGWDCHGLPIEWAVEQDYKARGIAKEDIDPVQFRTDCRAYAAGWVDVQRDQFKRFGVLADWNKPYLTMNYSSEAAILGELLKFAKSGLLYRDAKPVMWSPAERTGLADSDVEYKDVTSTQVDVGFQVCEYNDLAGAYVVIWTTTPWTLPANQALAYGMGVKYAIYTDNLDRRLILAESQAEAFATRAGLHLKRDRGVHGSELATSSVYHPMFHLGGFYATPRPLLMGAFVTDDQGTGFVHMAPDHGEDDFNLCAFKGIPPAYLVRSDGRYPADWVWPLEGTVIGAKFNAPDGPVCEALRERGALFAASHDFKHSYPFSNRSKAKLIQRATPQWFINVVGGDEPTVVNTALKAIDDTKWYPEKAKTRIASMVMDRPDWLVSRQRLWGVPMALYVRKGTNEFLQDDAVNERILAAFREKGADAWYDADHAALLGSEYSLADYEPVTDVLDVWFDSGSTHSYVMGGKQADLYLEGSDQHRGWFQASLLESCGTLGRAPFKAVLTHGFALDQHGKKMSKSVGNVVDPLAEIAVYGADVLRLWVAMTDITEDVRVGKKVLEGTLETYKKFRNTLRYMVGALDNADFTGRSLDFRTYPALERYMLSRLSTLNKSLPEKLKAYDFNGYVRELFTFCNSELSSFYFDIRKDTLYCDPQDSHTRQCYLTVLNMLFRAVIGWLKPVLVFTAEEAWQASGRTTSVHLEPAPGVVGFQDLELEKQWLVVKRYRDQVNEAVERLIKSGQVKSAGDVRLTLSVPEEDYKALDAADFKSVALLGELELNEALFLETTGYLKCERCWRRDPLVDPSTMLCERCAAAIK
jgi:isoleucyl-tRNA synthetase